MNVQEKELQELEDLQEELKISQLNQHFIFNALNVIKCAAIVDKRQACHLIDDFSKYLRYNLNALELKEAVPFRSEMEQVRAYANIEMARFPKVAIEYDLEAEDFFIPPMSIQPLVENAVGHGLCKTMKGGRVLIRSYSNEQDYVVEIVDDGVGFEIESTGQDSQKPGGINNIRIRLEKLMNGSLYLESAPGCGTLARVSVPVEYARKRKYNHIYC